MIAIAFHQERVERQESLTSFSCLFWSFSKVQSITKRERERERERNYQKIRENFLLKLLCESCFASNPFMKVSALKPSLLWFNFRRFPLIRPNNYSLLFSLTMRVNKYLDIFRSDEEIYVKYYFLLPSDRLTQKLIQISTFSSRFQEH